MYTKAKGAICFLRMIIQFFGKLANKVKILGITNPAQVINLDETGYDSVISSTVLRQIGVKCVSQAQVILGKKSSL